MKKNIYISFIFILSILLGNSNIYSATYYTLGSNNWGTGGNWSATDGGPTCNCVPGAGDIAYIVDGDVISVNGYAINVDEIHVIEGSTLTFNNGWNGQITANTVNIDNGTITDAGTANLTVINIGDLNIGVNVSSAVTSKFELVGGPYNNPSQLNLTITNLWIGNAAGDGTAVYDYQPEINFASTLSITNKGEYSNGSYTCSPTGTVAPACPSPSPLPVTLLDFDGQYGNEQVLLKWATASEINNDYFTVEHSTDGETYKEKAKIEGAGISNQYKTYTYIDESPSQCDNYYRLKQTDYDGKFEYIKTISVLADCFERGIVKPEFVKYYKSDGVFNITFKASGNKNYTLQVYTISGLLVGTKSGTTSELMTTVQVNQTSSSGVLYFILEVDGEFVSRRIIK